MSLQLTLDHALQIVVEPGFYQRFSSEDWEHSLNPTGTNSAKAFWSDQATRTLMLMPLQLQQGFLNSSQQLDSIVGLIDRGSGKLVIHDDNRSRFLVWEGALAQNANNPWVHFAPVPGTGSGILAELLAQIALIALEARMSFPITTSDPRVIAYSEERIPGNQALYLRWSVPNLLAGQYPSLMGFCIGQFVLIFSGDQMQVVQDISPAGDRTDFRHIMYAPLWSPGGIRGAANNAPANRQTVAEPAVGERAILWLPFHRNLVYVEASSGAWAVIDARADPKLNGKSGNDQDWDIVQDRNLLVWALTPSTGHFQIQKVKWAGPTAKTANLPIFTLDYAPVSPLTSGNIVLEDDVFRGTALSVGTPTTPPGYTDFINTLDDCPPMTTDPSAQWRQYGATITFQSDANQRFTPFLYGVDIRVPATVGTWAVSGITIGDTRASMARVRHATITASLEPGENQLHVEVADTPPYQLATRWYRSAYPIRLQDTSGPTTLFVGITDPPEVQPLRLDTNIHRDLKLQASDLWKWLSDAPLRDQRDWTGTGHIDVVDFIVRQAGIDTTGADYPTPKANWNTPLGSVPTATVPAPMQNDDKSPLRAHWKPSPTDTAASFIKRVATEFAGFVVGFYPDGTFYYLPRDPWFYNTSEVTFASSRTGSAPVYEDPVVFTNEEPEANVVQVIAKDTTGAPLESALQIDWASILNKDAPNFLGRQRLLVYPADGVLTCREINRIALVLWRQVRRRHLKVKFRADYYPALKVGRCFTLSGYTGIYRLLSYMAEHEKQGYKQANYEAELVEAGAL